MNYLALFEVVRAFLKNENLTVKSGGCERVIAADFAAAELKLRFTIPEDLKEVYRQLGNGYYFSWKSGKEQRSRGSFGLPILDEIVDNYVSECQLFSSDKPYNFPYVDDPELAKLTVRKMKHWVYLLMEGNGDSICLDMAEDPPTVVFNSHDWFDGGTGANGHIMAANLPEFMLNWASRCFQDPKSLFWSDCFKEPAGIDWDGEQFENAYKIEREVLEAALKS